MAKVFFPPLLRPLVEGAEVIDVPGENVNQIVTELEQRYPGLQNQLRQGEDLRSGFAVAVDGFLSNRGLRQTVTPTSEVHFLPAIGGG